MMAAQEKGSQTPRRPTGDRDHQAPLSGRAHAGPADALGRGLRLLEGRATLKERHQAQPSRVHTLPPSASPAGPQTG